MALAPEVHSALLSSGPGPGPLLAAAGAWNSLSAEYVEVADELSALVAAVQAGAWEGPSAESYAAANVPYAAWLVQAAANAAATAAQHETAAGAYTAALAAMPTLGELAANHATHAALVATNFFGINTIPIALNEADYVRMWIQAATTMSIYQGFSAEAVAAVPSTPPAPTVLKSGGPSAATDPSPANILTDWEDFVENVMDKLFGVQSPPYLLAAFEAFLEDPSPALFGALLFALTYEVAFDTLFFSPLTLLEAPLLPVVGLAGLPALAGLVGLAGLAGLAQPGQVPATVSQIPESPATQAWPAAALGSTVAPAGTAGSAATGPPTPASAPASAPAPAAGTATFGYLVFGAGPDEGQGPTLIGGGKIKAPSSDIAAAAAAPARTSAQERSRRRRRAAMRDYGDEYMDIDSDLAAPPADAPAAAVASTQGAGTLGFTGTVSKADGVRPEGLIALADGFGGGPTAPRLPQTWGSDDSEDSPGPGGPEDSGQAGR